MLVLGNKCDLENKEVDEEDLKTFYNQYNIEVVEASAKSSHNIESTMSRIGNLLIKRYEAKNKEKNLSGDKYKNKHIKISNDKSTKGIKNEESKNSLSKCQGCGSWIKNIRINNII